MPSLTENEAKRRLEHTKSLQRLCLAQQDLDFAIDGLNKFIDIDDMALDSISRTIKDHLFYSIIISYGKIFASSRYSSIGIVKESKIDAFKIPENRVIHNNIIKIRNECVAHNDGLSQHVQITWSKKSHMHFPQCLRKEPWNKEEASNALSLMKIIQDELITEIYRLFRTLRLKAEVDYVVRQGGLKKGPIFRNKR